MKPNLKSGTPVSGVKAKKKPKVEKKIPIGSNQRNPYKSLEIQFNCKITTYPDEKFGICRISNETGNIQVKPLFEFLDIKIQKLLIIQVQKLNSLSIGMSERKYYDSDKYAVDEIVKLYPKIDKVYLKKAFCILLMESPTNLNVNRCEALIESLYYETGRKPSIMHGVGINDMDMEYALAGQL